MPERALGAGAVVAVDVDDQRVVELAHVLDRLDHAADLVVGIGNVARRRPRPAARRASSVGLQRIPLRQASGHGVSFVLAGITPRRFWLAKIWSRSAFQPMSNLPLNLSIHSCFGWCGEWLPPGT